MEKLKVSILQSNLHWENIKANLKAFEKQIDSIRESTDLILLPEMFTTGFSMNAFALAEAMLGQTITWLQKQAAKKNAVVAGTFIVKENNQFYNRLVWMSPNASYQTYDKKHLFTLAKEHETYTAGKERLIVNLKGWNICPLICYDLRFPIWSRNDHAYDLLIYLANWPSTRSSHWKSLLLARAIENQSYTIGVNRVGKDGLGNYYSGDSCVIDFSGKKLYQISHNENICTISLDKKEQLDFRQKLNFLPDQDRFEIL